MADGKIYITISDERKASNNVSTNSTNATLASSSFSGSSFSSGGTTGESSSSALGGYAKMQFFTFIKSEAMNIANYTLGNIGNFTGNYQQQADVNVALSTISSVANIGNAAIQGAMIGGPWGALIGVGIAVGVQAINFGLSEQSNRVALSKQNEMIDQVRERTGNNSLLDGSRGTLY